VAQYRQLAGTGRTAAEPEETVRAACEGRVETLFLPAGVQCWGRYDPAEGHLEMHEAPMPGDDELLNLTAVQTLRHGGTVYLLPQEEMPERGCLAAIYCLPLARR
jgi:hypothetical protein